jgi:His/Glu/Gln/Arg/opine family amino acid ABC transporter permease subunit
MNQVFFDAERWAAVWFHRWDLLSGIWTMLFVIVVSLVLSTIGGMILAMMRQSRSAPVAAAGFVVIQLFRGVPLYVLLLWMFFGLAIAAQIRFDPIPAGIAAIVILNSGFMAEVFRAAMQAVPEGQREAAMALGMTRFDYFRFVQMPQAVRIALPAGGNVLVDIVKETAVLSVITVPELMLETNRWADYYFAPFEFYTAAAIIYSIIVLIAMVGWRALERYSSRYLNSRHL